MKLKENAYNVSGAIQYDINLTVGIPGEYILSQYISVHINEMLTSIDEIELSPDDNIFNLEYSFDEIVEDEDIDDLSLDYDFREMYS